jgi:cephalosporin hydroxylase
MQELIYRLKPDVIIETGVAHGGSMVFYAGLCRLMGKGRVIGIDIEIRPHNRKAIEEHPLADLITLIEGSSIEPATIRRVQQMVQPGQTVMVMLDSCHSRDHVRQELEAYAPLVSVGSYIVAMDGIMRQVTGAPRTRPDWTWNNPIEAAEQFIRDHPNFVIEQPPFGFNEGSVRGPVSYWVSGYIKRVS